MEDDLLRVFPDKKDVILNSIGNNVSNSGLKPGLAGILSDTSYLAAIQLNLKTIGNLISETKVKDLLDVEIGELVNDLDNRLDVYKKMPKENAVLRRKNQELEDELAHSKESIKNLEETIDHEESQAVERERKLLARISELDEVAAEEEAKEQEKQRQEAKRLRERKEEAEKKSEEERVRKEKEDQERIRKESEERERIRKEAEAQRVEEEERTKEKEQFEREQRELEKLQKEEDARLKETQTEGHEAVEWGRLFTRFLEKLNERKGARAAEFKIDGAVDAKSFTHLVGLRNIPLSDVDLFVALSESRTKLIDDQSTKDININLSKAYRNLRLLLERYVHGKAKSGFPFTFKVRGAIHQILKGLLWIDLRIYKRDITMLQTFVKDLAPKSDIGDKPDQKEVNEIFKSVSSLLAYYTSPSINILFTKLNIPTVKGSVS